MRVYYLTSSHHALGNLALKRLKISRFTDLNDPFELLAVDLKDKAHRRAFLATKEKINESKGLICFSRSWSNPVLWGHYAEKHSGIALGFEIDDKKLADVIYSKTPLTIPVNKKTNKPEVSENLMDKLLRTKFSDWTYEEEVRFFVTLDHKTKESGMYFFNFSNEVRLCEVILGPKCELPIESIRAIVAGYPTEIEVIKSRIAFSSFKVVKNVLATSK